MLNRKPTPAIAYIIVGLGALFYCYEYFLRIAPSVMRHELMTDFDLNATLFGTLSAFYYYAYTPMQLLVGVIVDRYSVRRVLLLAVIACVLGSFMMANARAIDIGGLKLSAYALASAGRFLQGFGSAFAFVGALKLASMWLPPDRFAFFGGLAASLGFFGAAVGEIGLNYIVQYEGWRLTLNSFVFLGLGLAFALWLSTRGKARAPQHHSHKIIHIKDSWLALVTILKIPQVWVSGLVSYLMFLPTTVFADLWGVTYFEKLHLYSRSDASLVTAMIFIGWAIGCPLIGWISDRMQNRIACMRIGALAACIISIIALYDVNLGFPMVCILLIAFGILSASQVLTFPYAKDLSPKQAVGTAIAFINMLSMMGGFIFQRGIGQILDWHWSGAMLNNVPVYTLSDYMHAMMVIPISLGLAFIITLFMRDSLKP